jgi:hypothetical protein
MSTGDPLLNIDEYLRDRLMPVEGTIPHIPGMCASLVVLVGETCGLPLR